MGGLLDLGMNKFSAWSLNTNIPLIYEPATQGLPANVSFDPANFRQPIQVAEKNTFSLLPNLRNNLIPSALVASTLSSTDVDCLATDVVDSGEVLTRTADISHLHLLIQSICTKGEVNVITLPPKVWRPKSATRYIPLD